MYCVSVSISKFDKLKCSIYLLQSKYSLIMQLEEGLRVFISQHLKVYLKSVSCCCYVVVVVVVVVVT